MNKNTAPQTPQMWLLSLMETKTVQQINGLMGELIERSWEEWHELWLLDRLIEKEGLCFLGHTSDELLLLWEEEAVKLWIGEDVDLAQELWEHAIY